MAKDNRLSIRLTENDTKKMEDLLAYYNATLTLPMNKTDLITFLIAKDHLKLSKEEKI